MAKNSSNVTWFYQCLCMAYLFVRGKDLFFSQQKKIKKSLVWWRHFGLYNTNSVSSCTIILLCKLGYRLFKNFIVLIFIINKPWKILPTPLLSYISNIWWIPRNKYCRLINCRELESHLPKVLCWSTLVLLSHRS